MKTKSFKINLTKIKQRSKVKAPPTKVIKTKLQYNRKQNKLEWAYEL